MQYCTHCGTGMPEGANFCPACGTRAAGAAAPARKIGARQIALVAVTGLALWGAGWTTQRALGGAKPVGHAAPRETEAELSPELQQLKRVADSAPANIDFQRPYASRLIQELRASDTPPAPIVFEAIEVLSRILKVDPEDREALIAMSDISFTQQVFVKAVDYYERYLKLEPQDLDARARYASALAFTGRFDDAIGELNGILEKDPSNFHAAAYLAIVHAQSGNDAAALESGTKALALAPNDDARARFQGFLDAVKSGEVRGENTQPAEAKQQAPAQQAQQPAASGAVAAAETAIKSSPIAGPRFRGAELLADGALVMRFESFPMADMPQPIRERFVNNVAQAVSGKGVKSLVFLDAANGAEMHRMTLQ